VTWTTKQPETGEYPKATQQSYCSCPLQHSDQAPGAHFQGEELSGGRAGGDIRGQIDSEGGYQEGRRGPGMAVPQSLGRAPHDPRSHGWHWTLAHFGTVEYY
jgi:hypothetical protein